MVYYVNLTTVLYTEEFFRRIVQCDSGKYIGTVCSAGEVQLLYDRCKGVHAGSFTYDMAIFTLRSGKAEYL